MFTVLFLFSAPLLTGQKSINTLKRIKYENEIDIFLFFLAFLFSACEDDFDYLYSGPYNEREEWVPLDRTIAPYLPSGPLIQPPISRERGCLPMPVLLGILPLQ